VTNLLARRLLALPLLLLGVSVVVFLVLRLSPGDPAERILSQSGDFGGDREAVAALRKQLGLDVSIAAQYARWLSLVSRGDFGASFQTGRPVWELFAERLPATLALTSTALLLAIAVALPLGIASALTRGRWLDGLCRVAALAGVSIPSFWLGLLLVWTFAVWLGWLPAIGSGEARHLVMPSVALACGVAATQARLLRASMLDVLGQPYVGVARAKGLRHWNVVIGHALRNALIPSVTALGLSIGSLLGGAAVVETVFAYPGVGKLAIDAIGTRDYPVIQAFVLCTTAIYVVCGIVVDLLYSLLDPRIRVGSGDA
jgi:peptide/nickel transport system permease protein